MNIRPVRLWTSTAIIFIGAVVTSFAPRDFNVVGMFVMLFAGILYFIDWISSHEKAPPPAGKCVTCGYLLRGNVSGVCPECGTPVPARSKSPTRD